MLPAQFAVRHMESLTVESCVLLRSLINVDLVHLEIKGATTVQNVDCRTPGVGIATTGLTTCTESKSCDGGGGGDGGGGPTTCGSCGPGPYGEEHDQRCCNHFGADMIATKVTPRRTTCASC